MLSFKHFIIEDFSLHPQDNTRKRLSEEQKKPRLTPEQKKALEAYKYAEKQEDRYLGSVFANPLGQRDHEAKVRAAYERCKRLGMGVEHGL